MFNIGTILIFIIGLIVFLIIKKKTKRKAPLIIYIISFIFIYLISSAILNDYLIENYLDNIDNGNLVYIELEKIPLDKITEEENEFYCKAADYLEDRYRAMYYIIDGEEIYQELGQGLLVQEITDVDNGYKTKVTLRYNELLRKFFMQFKTKTFKIIQTNEENILKLN